jgi:serine phosphatase RsbU (regulator of sigma subunit)
VNEFGHRLPRLLGWYTLKLSSRLLLAQAAVCVLLLGSLMFFSAWAFKADKAAYVYDVLALRTERLTREILGRLESAALDRRHLPVSTSEAIDFVEQAGLPRLPKSGEYFLGSRSQSGAKRVPLVLTKQGDNWLLFPMPAAALAEETALNAWWTLSGTHVLARSPRLYGMRDDSLLQREEVGKYLESGLRQGLLTVKREDGKASLSGFEEVPRTNTVVFVETSEQEAMAPLVRFIATALFFGSLIILGGLVLLSAVFKSLWKPVDHVAEISDRVANGQYDIDVSYPYRDEMKGIFERLGRMARLLSSREAGLKRLTHTLEGSLDTTRAMTLATDPFSAVAHIQSQLELRLRFSNAPEGWLAWSEDGSLPQVTIVPVSTQEGTSLVNAKEAWSALDSALQDDLLVRSWRLIEGFAKGTDAEDVELVDFLFGKPYLRLAVSRKQKTLVLVVGPLMSRTVTSDERVLCRSLCTSLRVVLENLDLRSDAATKARLEAELETAEAMQQNMIRVECTDERLDVSAQCAPAARVGGDWCGVHEVPSQSCVYVFVADVTGHGIDSSLVSASACGVMNALCTLASSGEAPRLLEAPSERLVSMATWVNESLIRTGRGRYAMSLILLCVEPASRRVTVVSCGHTPAWKFGPDKEAKSVPSRGSLLGLSPNVTFSPKEIVLDEGESLFLYTDGLLENEGPGGERLTPRQLKSMLRDMGSMTSRGALDAVMAKHASLLGSAEAADDTTCLVLRFRTTSEIQSSTPAPMRTEISVT